MRLFGLTFTLIASLWATAEQESVEIRRILRQGDAQAFTVRVELERGESVSLVESRVVETVEQVDEAGRATVRTRYLSVRIGGVSAGTRPDDRTLVGPTGAILSIFSTDADAFRLARALAITGVPRAAASWTLEQEAGKDPVAPPARTVYSLKGIELLGDRRSAQIQFEFRENPSQGQPLEAKGVYWLELGTGRLLQLEAELKGLPGIPQTDTVAKVVVQAKED